LENTQHYLKYNDARNLATLEKESIDLVVTSPPYPMIEMWDETFNSLSSEIGDALQREDYYRSFSLMHEELDKVWDELYRVLRPGGFACINIGDAARTIGDKFQLFSNHSRIINSFWEKGFDTLPVILWRKQTNAPNKFMGSGMLPAGAYVTLEHEYVLIFRKGNKREFKTENEKKNRRESAIFWEERNTWFSDLWDFKGIRQNISLNNTKQKEVDGKNNLRERSGAYPLLLPYRLISMFSVYGDTVLDPFLGTGTTSLAAMICGRNSVGYEIDKNFASYLDKKIEDPGLVSELNSYHYERILNHQEFVEEYTSRKGHPPKYSNEFFNFPVVTRQEINLKLVPIKKVIKEGEGKYKVDYDTFEKFFDKIVTPSNNENYASGQNLYQGQLFNY